MFTSTPVWVYSSELMQCVRSRGPVGQVLRVGAAHARMRTHAHTCIYRVSLSMLPSIMHRPHSHSWASALSDIKYALVFPSTPRLRPLNPPVTPPRLWSLPSQSPQAPAAACVRFGGVARLCCFLHRLPEYRKRGRAGGRAAIKLSSLVRPR